MFCSSCGTQVNEGSKFCGACGASLAVHVNTTVSAPAQAPVAGDDSETVLMAQPVEQDMQTVFAADAMPFPQPMPLYSQQTVQSQPVQAEQPMQQASVDVRPAYSGAPAKQPKKKVSAGVVAVVCILFGLLIFVFGLAAGVAESARSTLANGLISQEVKDIKVLDVVIGDILLSDALVDDIDALMEDYDRDIRDIEDSTTVSEFVIVLADSDSVTEKKLEKIIKDTTFMDYLGRVVESYEEYLLEDADGNVVSVDEIQKLVDKNIDDVEDVMDTVFLIDEDELEETLKENEDTLEGINPQNALNGVGPISSLVLSPVAIIVAAALVLLLAVLIAVFCRSVSTSMMTLGICSVLIGGVMMAVCLLKSVIADTIGLTYSVVDDVALELLDNTLLGEMMKYGLIIAGVGVFMIVVAAIIKVVSASVRAKKATN